MARIAIAPENVLSHLNATYRIGKWLSSRGHEVIYVLQDSLFRDDVRANGFEYTLVEQCLSASDANAEESASVITDSNLGRHARLRERAIAETLIATKPDLIILDTFLALCAIALHAKVRNIVIFQTKVATNKYRNIPPPTSAFLPGDSFVSAICVEFLWLKTNILRRMNRLLERFVLQRADYYSTVEQLGREAGFPLSVAVDFDRPFGIGIANLPEVILSPRCFDFPWRDVGTNQRYLGPTVLLERTEFISTRLESKLAGLRREKHEYDRRVVFCSLGTVGIRDVKKRTAFFWKVVMAFGGDKRYNLIVTVGDDIDPRLFKHGQDNVVVMRRVPQMRVLSICDVMLTHGGMQSVSECILAGVPMVVYPQGLDQHGNAARVVYHGLGVRGGLGPETGTRIKRRVEEVLANSSYRQRVEKMRAKMLDCRDFVRGMEEILGMVGEGLDSAAGE